MSKEARDASQGGVSVPSRFNSPGNSATVKRRAVSLSPRERAALPRLGKWLTEKEGYQARGFLLKLSSKGMWQKRLYELRGPFLCYWTSEAMQKPSATTSGVSEPDVFTDLRAINAATLEKGPPPFLSLVTSDGSIMQIKAAEKKDEANLQLWLRAIKAAMHKHDDGTAPLTLKQSMSVPQAIVKREPGSMTPELLSLLREPYQARGFLLKLSSKGMWQRRLYELRGPFLCYWASEAAQKSSGASNNFVSEPDASVDLRFIGDISLEKGPSPFLSLTSSDGITLQLKAAEKKDEAHLSLWRKALQAALQKHKRSSESVQNASDVPSRFESRQKQQSTTTTTRRRSTSLTPTKRSPSVQTPSNSADPPSELMASLQLPYEARGFLLKLSSKGMWQKRLYEIRGPFLCYWASEAAQKVSSATASVVAEPDASVDLRAMATITLENGPPPFLTLTSSDGHLLQLKAAEKKDDANLRQWRDAIYQASRPASAEVPDSGIDQVEATVEDERVDEPPTEERAGEEGQNARKSAAFGLFSNGGDSLTTGISVGGVGGWWGSANQAQSEPMAQPAPSTESTPLKLFGGVNAEENSTDDVGSADDDTSSGIAAIFNRRPSFEGFAQLTGSVSEIVGDWKHL